MYEFNVIAKLIVSMLPTGVFLTICQKIWAIIVEICTDPHQWPMSRAVSDKSLNNTIMTTIGNGIRLPFMVSYFGVHDCSIHITGVIPHGTTYVFRAARNTFYMPVYIADGFIHIANPSISLLLTSFQYNHYALCDPNLVNTIARKCLWKLRRFQLLMVARWVFNVFFGWARILAD